MGITWQTPHVASIHRWRCGWRCLGASIVHPPRDSELGARDGLEDTPKADHPVEMDPHDCVDVRRGVLCVEMGGADCSGFGFDRVGRVYDGGLVAYFVSGEVISDPDNISSFCCTLRWCTRRIHLFPTRCVFLTTG